MDLHPTFLELLHFEPTLSIARALLGPQVQIHASVLRVAYPELENQAVEWHFHQRLAPDPIPPWFHKPITLDCLFYLYDLMTETGPFVVLPGSHLTDIELPRGDFSEKAGQVEVTCKADDCVLGYSSLWNKARAPYPTSGKRRLIILGYSAVWQKQIDRPGNRLTSPLIDAGEVETRELLGRSGWY